MKYLSILADDLLTGAFKLFTGDLKLPVHRISEQAIDPRKLLGKRYEAARHFHLDRFFLVGQIGADSLSIGNPTARTESADSYPNMLLMAADSGHAALMSSDIRDLAQDISKAYTAYPVVLVLRYQRGQRLALTCCERKPYKQKGRIGERIGRAAVLNAINLRKPSGFHLAILRQLKFQPAEFVGMEPMLKKWRETFSSTDTELLLSIAREWIATHRTFPPMEKFGTLFGNEAVATIRNCTEWKTCYPFFRQSVQDDPELESLLLQKVKNHVHQEWTAFGERHGVAPYPSILYSQNRYQDLHLVSLKMMETWTSAFAVAEEFSTGSNHYTDRSPLSSDKIEAGTKKNHLDHFQDLLDLIQSYREGKTTEDDLLSLKADEEKHPDDEDEFSDDRKKQVERAASTDTGIRISKEALENGDYDDWQITPTSIAKRYENFIFTFLVGQVPMPTVGYIRKFRFNWALCDSGFTPRRQGLMLELQERLPEIVMKLKSQRALSADVEPKTEVSSSTEMDSGDLDIVVDDQLLPKWMIPLGRGIQRYKLLNIIKKQYGKVTIRTISSITSSQLLSIKSVRKNRAQDLARLKSEIPDLIKLKKAFNRISQAEHQGLVVRMNQLSPTDLITARKIAIRTGRNQLLVKDFFHPWEKTSKQQRVMAEKPLKKLDFWRLHSIRQKIALALDQGDLAWFSSNNIDSHKKLQSLEKALLAYLQTWIKGDFFNRSSDLSKKVFVLRHGLGGKRHTLEEISVFLHADGKRTRERVRQIQEKVEWHFIGSLPFTQEALLQRLRGKALESLAEEFPHLFHILAGSLENLRNFLSFLCGEDSFYREVDNRLLQEFFPTHPQPVTRKIFISWLKEKLRQDDNEEDEILPLQDSEEAAPDILKIFEMRGEVEISNGRIIPRNLRPPHAAAHILIAEPKRIPGSDLARLVRNSGYTKRKYTDRYLSQHRLNPYVYLSGCSNCQTIYKHGKYLPDVPDTFLDEMERWLVGSLKKTPGHRADLRKVHSEHPMVREWDYYVFRHNVSILARGSENLHFEGKSRSDNIRLLTGSEKRITNADRVLAILDELEGETTILEIANLFHRRSAGLIQLTLVRLIEQGKAIKTSSNFYASTNQFRKSLTEGERVAFSKIRPRLKKMLEEADNKGKILDVRVLEKEMNIEYGVTFHHSLYLSHIQSLKDKLGFQMHRSFVSFKKIPFQSHSDAFMQICSWPMDKETATAKVAEKIETTREVLNLFYQNYKREMTKSE